MANHLLRFGGLIFQYSIQMTEKRFFFTYRQGLFVRGDNGNGELPDRRSVDDPWLSRRYFAFSAPRLVLIAAAIDLHGPHAPITIPPGRAL
jgi:hypothetical protein